MEYVSRIREVSECLAKLDVLTCLSAVALENNYVKPVIDEVADFLLRMVVIRF